MRLVRLNRLSLSLSIVLGVAVVIVFFQARYIRALQLDEEQLASKGTVQNGEVVPDLDVLNSTGKRVLVPYAAIREATIIYVFRPGCPWCERNERAINSLVAQVGKRYRVIGLSLAADGLSEFLTAHPVSFSVYHDASPSVVAALHLGTTPETIVISPSGRVLKSWNGAYIGGPRDEIQKFFAIALPSDLVRATGS